MYLLCLFFVIKVLLDLLFLVLLSVIYGSHVDLCDQCFIFCMLFKYILEKSVKNEHIRDGDMPVQNALINFLL